MPTSYGTPQPGDDAQLRVWRRRYAEDTERGFSLRLPLALARRLRAEAAARGLPHSRYVADLLRVALGDLPGGPALAPTPTPAAPTPALPAPVALAVCRRERSDGSHDRGTAVGVGRPACVHP